MLNRAPYNTEVPEFQPSREAPINSYIVRKYPCQEQLANKTNVFRTLTWKIQQPDSSMVWQSVKVVLPMEIKCVLKNGTDGDMNVYGKKPTCNIALSQSPMNAFRQTTLTLNGRIFSEENFYRDILDTCYRGVGTQAYGDNHSLKPIVQRNVEGEAGGTENDVLDVNGDPVDPRQFVRVSDIEVKTIDSAFSLLEHNGPFIERARIFQDKLLANGEQWVGEISHLLELGPFQARARKGNTAVPYIQDFHMRLNFANNPSRFDVENPTRGDFDDQGGRTMAPKLLEFATVPNFLHHGERAINHNGWPADFTFSYTAKPYLEVTYTKHTSGLRPSYNLRCFSHQYEQGNRFLLPAPSTSFNGPSSLQRVTTRLLSLPTKVYVWADLADEYKHSFISGGVRRSCELSNLHLRVNQRPDVMFNPSQEECYEMFRRHTNSSLEYGSWLKSPIYCFDMVDIGQPDMFANDARITWMEWDSQVSLTNLQITELQNLNEDANMQAHAYDRTADVVSDYSDNTWLSTTNVINTWDFQKHPQISFDDTTGALTLVHKRDGVEINQALAYADAGKVLHSNNTFHIHRQPHTTFCDMMLKTSTCRSMSLKGMIWAKVLIGDIDATHPTGAFHGKLWYVPESYRYRPAESDLHAIFVDIEDVDITYAAAGEQFSYAMKTAPHVKPPVPFVGTLVDNTGPISGMNNVKFGRGDSICKWAPGTNGYEIDPYGIRNSAADQAYLRGGLKPLVLLDEKVDPLIRWCCIAVQTQMKPGGTPAGNTWAKYRSDVAANDVVTDGGAAYWPAQVKNAVTEWGAGAECLNIRGLARWGYLQPEQFRDVDPLYGVFGSQMTKDINQNDMSQGLEYRMKVLYEYGNEQYEFAANAAPTRVLPNVVPVGPTSGIPIGM